MRHFNLTILATIFLTTFYLTSCNQTSKSDDKDKALTEKENELLKKENELLKKEQELNQKAVKLTTDNQTTKQQQSNDEALLKKKHLQYLTPRLDGRTAGMKILFGDLNGDGVKDAFIDWCIEATGKDYDAGGGNALMFLQCMEEGFSVYIKTGNEYVLSADKGKSYFTDEGFSFDADKIENGKIICSNLSYSDDDPRCCPSLKRTIYLVFKNNKIERPEQKVKVTKQQN